MRTPRPATGVSRAVRARSPRGVPRVPPECRKGVPETPGAPRDTLWTLRWEMRNIYHHHHPESKKRKSSEANSGAIHPYGRYGNAVKTRKTISTIAILWPVKAIFEKRAATVEVDTLISPAPEPGARRRAGGSPLNTPLDTPRFRRHSRGHFGPEGPERLL